MNFFIVKPSGLCLSLTDINITNKKGISGYSNNIYSTTANMTNIILNANSPK
ncbi:hypothetical protein LZZ90_13175 [Flavobacterium sp. SM15]|uniref:hypothetical protein n=1 Tax=Flavobacterium sp. SM15 TaxID=2908005 RepID=UPI001EDAC7D2|nr:hypothetical protein [Flavobacterium sp. SM15]MCG2612461.1 hypothetical protein [Flavobacterium sp. SM15]